MLGLSRFAVRTSVGRLAATSLSQITLTAAKPSTINVSRRYLAGGVEWHGTTILCVRKDGKTVMAGDGQVSMGSSVVKGNAKKVRRLGENILVGFAGSTADALTLLERLEKKLEEHPGQLTRACVELAKAWRTDKYLRRLEAVLLVADANNIFELTGNGDVLEPEKGVMGVGSGGSYALAAALALIDQPGVDAEEIARRAMKIAGDICVYTNHNVRVEVVTASATTTEAKPSETKPPETPSSSSDSNGTGSGSS
jgi:ATP-dependent HslUV protease subunit HslV